ncbi:hypothetical protein CDAR_387591 [Caerostris darwini]|uniref:Uncharacterized protein n=1 Tax=Caerostris darwini TaxID=1538125 RepID=A0AAV4TI63_9ARAC|nr:hypothetical protein CDAR_387591 [Caerostris darwini]
MSRSSKGEKKEKRKWLLVTILGERINDCDVSRILRPLHQKKKECSARISTQSDQWRELSFRYLAARVISGVYRLQNKSVEKEKRNSRMLSRCSARTQPSH